MLPLFISFNKVYINGIVNKINYWYQNWYILNEIICVFWLLSAHNHCKYNSHDFQEKTFVFWKSIEKHKVFCIINPQAFSRPFMI